jgi:hypothetical protein
MFGFLFFPLRALSFGGSLMLDYYGLVDPETFYDSERIRITVTSDIESGDEPEWFNFYISAFFFYQPIGEPVFADFERIIREAYVGFHFSIFDIYLGQKFLSWGKVDVMSPLNVVGYADTDILSLDNVFESSLADLLAQVTVYISDFLSIDLIYVPFVQPNLYSIEQIDVEYKMTIPGFGGPDIKYDADASFVNREVPLFSEWAHSLHTALHFISDAIDITATYSYYVDNFLDFDLSGLTEDIDDSGPTIDHTIRGTVYPEYNRVHNIGLGLSFYLEDFLISCDAALKLMNDWDGTIMELRNHEFFYAIQAEYIFFTKWYTQLGFFHRIIFNAEEEISSPYSSLVEGIIKDTIDDYMLQKPSSQIYVLLHVDTHFFNETLRTGINFIYGYSENAYYLAPRISYKINDYITVFAGADLWWKGMVEGYLGMNTEKDNAFLRVQCSL